MGLFGGSDKDVVIRFLVDSDDAVKGFEEVEGRLGDVVASAAKFGTIFAGAALSAGAAIGELAERGDQLNDVSDAFDGLAAASGTTANVLLTQLQTATQGQTSAFELMKAANDSLLKGLKPDQFVKIAQAAKEMADRTGGDATQALGALSNAIELGNARALKQFGIFVDQNRVLDDYAAKLGKTKDELDATQRIEAIRSAALQILSQRTGTLAKETGGLGDRYAELKTNIQNAFDEIAKGVDKSKILITVFGTIGEAAELIAGDIKEVFSDLDGYLSRAGARIVGIVSNIATFAPGNLGVVAKVYRDNLDQILQKLSVDVPQASEKSTNKFKELLEQINKVGVEGTASTEKTTKALKEQENQLAKINKELERRIKVLTSAPDLSDVIKGFNLSVDDAIGKGDNGLVDALGQGIGDAIVESIKVALSGGNSKDFKQTTKDILDPLSKASGAAFGGTAGFAIGGPIGAAIGASIGSAAADAIDEAIVDGLFSAFGGGDSAGTKARKQIDAFFADIFEPAELAVLIGGKLTEVSDLVFSGNQEGGLFAGLPAAAQAAFEGVGVAFEQLNGIALDLGVNVGNVLANNLGGSLNNLGIALQTTGQSAEQLGDQIIQAGLKGDLSFQQVASSLHGVELAMQKGIPDGVGLVVQAFDNLKNAGVAGGRVSTDAMRDLADELLEVDKNANGIDALGQKLLDSGVATDEVTQLMEALKSVGLDTVQKLSEATDRQLFEALARLQTIEFPFAQTSKDLDELLDKLDRIPDSIEKDITFNVKTNYQGDSRTVLNEAGVSLSPGGQGVG